jgi:hypothetical protein
MKNPRISAKERDSRPHSTLHQLQGNTSTFSTCQLIIVVILTETLCGNLPVCDCTCTQIISDNWLGRVSLLITLSYYILSLSLSLHYKFYELLNYSNYMFVRDSLCGESMLLKFGYPSRLFALWSGEFFRFLTLLKTVKF